jgi:hypothetical protein
MTGHFSSLGARALSHLAAMPHWNRILAGVLVGVGAMLWWRVSWRLGVFHWVLAGGQVLKPALDRRGRWMLLAAELGLGLVLLIVGW